MLGLPRKRGTLVALHADSERPPEEGSRDRARSDAVVVARRTPHRVLRPLPVATRDRRGRHPPASAHLPAVVSPLGRPADLVAERSGDPVQARRAEPSRPLSHVVVAHPGGRRTGKAPARSAVRSAFAELVARRKADCVWRHAGAALGHLRKWTRATPTRTTGSPRREPALRARREAHRVHRIRERAGRLGSLSRDGRRAEVAPPPFELPGLQPRMVARRPLDRLGAGARVRVRRRSSHRSAARTSRYSASAFATEPRASCTPRTTASRPGSTGAGRTHRGSDPSERRLTDRSLPVQDCGSLPLRRRVRSFDERCCRGRFL